MANSKLKCTGCKDRFESGGMIRLPAGNFHSIECATGYARSKQRKDRERQIKRERNTEAAKKKAARAKHRDDKERIKTRKQWLDQLQKLVNQYVLHVLEKDAPCRTCGTTNKSIKYDAGHYLSRGAHPELRFTLTNIHRQCSVRCNMHGSGMRKEYSEFIISHYGQQHLDWLHGPHKSLKEQLPHYTDVKYEIAAYRKLLRDNGLRPNA